MKGIFKGDDFKAVAALALVVRARSLDRALDSFCAGVCEKHGVRKSGIHQPLGKCLTLRAAIQVRHMDQCRCLILNGFGQMRVAVPKQVHSDARCEIKRAATVFGNQPSALAAHRSETATRIDGHQRRDRHGIFPSNQMLGIFQKPKSGPAGPLVLPFRYKLANMANQPVRPLMYHPCNRRIDAQRLKPLVAFRGSNPSLKVTEQQQMHRHQQ